MPNPSGPNARVWKGNAAGLQHCQLRSIIQTDNWPSRRSLETGWFGWPGAWHVTVVAADHVEWCPRFGRKVKTGLSRKISIPFCKGGRDPSGRCFSVPAVSCCCTMCYWSHAALCFLWWGEHPDLHRLHLYSTTKAGLGRIIGFFSMLLWRWRWVTLVERGSAGYVREIMV